MSELHGNDWVNNVAKQENRSERTSYQDQRIGNTEEISIMCDASFSSKYEPTGIGIISKNRRTGESNSETTTLFCKSSLEGEAWAVMEAVEKCKSIRGATIAIYSDNLAVIQGIRQVSAARWNILPIIRMIRTKAAMAGLISFYHISRRMNSQADHLAKTARHGASGGEDHVRSIEGRFNKLGIG